MEVAWIITVAVALGMDAFSLALALGLAGGRKRFFLIFPLIVTGFHILMPLAGMLIGRTFGVLLGRIAVLLGAGILIFLGGRTLLTLYRQTKEKVPLREGKGRLFALPSRLGIFADGWSLFILAFSVSLDALSVGFGFSLGTQGNNLGLTVLIIGTTAGLMTTVGLLIGRIAGKRLGMKAEFIGGLILLLIGVKLIF